MRITKKTIAITVAAILVAAAVYITLSRSTDSQYNNATSGNGSSVVSKETSETDRPSQVTVNDNGQKVSPDGTTVVGESPNTTPPDNSNQSVSLTNVSQDGGTVRVRAQLAGITAGTCELRLQHTDGAAITKTAPVILVTNYYTCEGFDIATNELPSGGDWQITVSLQGSTVSSQAKTITVQK